MKPIVRKVQFLMQKMRHIASKSIENEKAKARG